MLRSFIVSHDSDKLVVERSAERNLSVNTVPNIARCGVGIVHVTGTP